MLNRPFNRFRYSQFDGKSPDRMWRVDQNPGSRLLLLFVVMLLPLFVVSGRLIHLQCVLSDTLQTRGEPTNEVFEPIPSVDGRILASDETTLAQNIERFDLLVHYRWLEQPADASWLRQRALSQLDRADRRDADRVAAEIQNVLQTRSRAWDRLAALVGTSPQKLTERRSRIQRRVERIVARVEQRRTNQRQSSEAQQIPAFPADGPMWEFGWQTVVAALTTPPERVRMDPLVVTEQLDYHMIVKRVDLKVAVEVEAYPNLYPGIRSELSTERIYPLGAVASHIIGNRTSITNEELKVRQQRFPDADPLDYQAGDVVGRTGVERSYDHYLRGLRGLRKIVKNRRGEIIRKETVREPRRGRDIKLTLSIGLQRSAERILDELLEPGPNLQAPDSGSNATQHGDAQGGCILVMNIHTGAILAAASGPRFDLNFASHPDPENWQRLLTDPRRPFFPRSTKLALPPGSVFKTLTSVALLESGINPMQAVHCQGYLDKPTRHRCYVYRHFGFGHGDLNLSDAICKSCNVYFFSAARSLYHRSAHDKTRHPILVWAERFGFGQPTGVDLPGEVSGNLPSGPRASLSEVLGLAIGQSRLTVTPLQMVRLIAAIANDGFAVTPHIVRPDRAILVNDVINAGTTARRTGSEDVSGISQTALRVPGLSSDTMRRIREGMQRVVTQGTGKRAQIEGVSMAGKTGTAEVGGGRADHAWFAGFVPAEQPRFAFVVVLEHAGSGGKAAAPVARKLVQSMLGVGLLRSTAVSMLR